MTDCKIVLSDPNLVAAVAVKPPAPSIIFMDNERKVLEITPDGELVLDHAYPEDAAAALFSAWQNIRQAHADQAAARRRMIVDDFICHVATVSEAIGFQAGVGGRETAGAIISYLYDKPDKLDAFMKNGVFGWDSDEWVTGGRLTWQANDGKVWHPAEARAARAAKSEDTDGPCTDCDDTGITIQTERLCACQPREQQI